MRFSHLRMLRGAGLLAVVVGSAAGVSLATAASDETVQLGSRDELMPLERYAGFGYTSERDEDTFNEENVARQNLIRDCMAANGLEYTPRPTPLVNPSQEQAADAQRQAAEAEEGDLAASGDVAAYYIALLGKADPVAANDPKTIDVDHNGAVDYLENFGGGCEGDAYRAIPGVFFRRNVLRAELEKLDADVAADAAMVELTSEWFECMAEKGFPGEDRIEVLGVADELQASGGDDSDVGRVANEIDDARGACDAAGAEREQKIRRKYEESFVEEHRRVLEGTDQRVAEYAREHPPDD